MASRGIKDRVAIIGMGCTRFGEHWDKGADDLLIDAAYDAYESARIDPMPGNEILSRSLGPAFGKALIIFGATNAVGVAVDDDGIFLDIRVDEDCRDLVELPSRLRDELGRIECKVHGAVE